MATGQAAGGQVRYWVPRDVAGLELQRGQFTRETFAPHAHDAFALVLMDAGAQAMRFHGRTVVAGPGSLLAVSAGEMHSGGAADKAVGWAYRIVYVEPAVLAAAAEQAGLSHGALPDFAAPLVRDPALARAFSATFGALTAHEAGALEREERLTHLLVRLVERHAAGPRRAGRLAACAPGVRRARALLEADVARNVPLRELARAAGLSPWHLVRAFREQLGQTPQVYQRTLRVKRAQQLLAGPLPLAEVALACGFTDQSHLTKQFTRTFGITPGEYRRAAVR